MNRTILSGNLCNEPDVRMTQDGKKTASFTLAVARTKNETDFIPCTAFDKIAEVFENYVKKGMKVVVLGKLNVKPYEDKQGNKRTYTSVIVNEVEFGNPKKEPKEPGYFDGAEDEFAPF